MWYFKDEVIYIYLSLFLGFPGGSDGKESAYNEGGPGLIPEKMPWRMEWLPTPVFLPGEFHGQKSLAGSLWGHQESDMTEQLTLSAYFCYFSFHSIRGVNI